MVVWPLFSTLYAIYTTQSDMQYNCLLCNHNLRCFIVIRTASVFLDAEVSRLNCVIYSCTQRGHILASARLFIRCI